MTLKERLLEALGATSLDHLSEVVLVEVLLDQLKQAKQDLFDARSAIFKEGLRADDIQRQAREDIHQLQNNPLAAAHGDFYFCGENPRATYIVSIGGHHNLRMFRRQGGIDYMMQQISPEKYARQQK